MVEEELEPVAEATPAAVLEVEQSSVLTRPKCRKTSRSLILVSVVKKNTKYTGTPRKRALAQAMYGNLWKSTCSKHEAKSEKYNLSKCVASYN